MLIETGFTLGRPLEESWGLLTDLERVAPAMPGVTVESFDAEGLHATMRVKVGPVTATYRTTVTIVSLDEATRTAVLRASGKETRGPGTVSATVTATMTAAGAATEVQLSTDLAVTGKIAQFGGGVMTEVADKLLRQFAESLEAQLGAAPASEPAAATPAVPAPAEAVDLGKLAGSALVPKAAPVLAGIGLALLALLLLRRRR
jgi:uncharacterized protein